MVMHR